MEEIAQLRRDGFCLLKGVIPEGEISGIRSDIDNAMVAGLKAYNELDWSAVTHMLSLAPYFADARLLSIVRTMFNHATVRISQTEFKSVPPRSDPPAWRGFHTDWPHDLTDRSFCGRVNQPFPDMIMSITSIWMLYQFTPENGATWVVPGTHRELHKPARGEGRNRRAQRDSERAAGLRRCRRRGADRQPHLALARSQHDRRDPHLSGRPLLALVAEYGVRANAMLPSSLLTSLTVFRSRSRSCTPTGGASDDQCSIFLPDRARPGACLPPIAQCSCGVRR